MAVRTGFSKMFHEHIKHIPGNLLQSVQEIMKSSKAETEKKAKAEKNEVKPPSEKELASARKQAKKKYTPMP